MENKIDNVWLYLVPFSLLLNMVMTRAKVPAVIVFGDSTVDSGNNNFIPTLVKSDFPPYGRDFPGGQPTGRFSNGRLTTDFVSEYFGLNPIVPAYLDPMYNISSFATGVCFASAATGFDIATSSVLNAIPVWKQLEYYKEYQSRLRAQFGAGKANYILREALYIVSIGTNDFILNYFLLPKRQAEFTIEEYEDFLHGLAMKFLKELFVLGARKISLAGFSPFGCLPVYRTINVLKLHGCIEKFNHVARDLNEKLEDMVATLNRELPGLTMVFANPYDIFYQMVNSPSSFGFEVAEKGCCASGTFEIGFLCNKYNPYTCKDASKYVFWDSVHPTEKAYQIIAKYSFQLFKRSFL